MLRFGGFVSLAGEVSLLDLVFLCYVFFHWSVAANWSPEVSSHLLTYLSGVGGWWLCQAQAWVGVGALSHVWNTIFTVQINRS